MAPVPIEITFPGGVRVDATYKGHTLRTDQPEYAGGADSAMSPFDIFLASIATCMGYYAVAFCRQREISTEGLSLTVFPERQEGEKRISTMRAELTLPTGFPERYVDAIGRAIDSCTVKRHLAEPPAVELHIQQLAAP